VLKGWRDLTSSAPEELQSGALLRAAPDLPGGSALAIRVCHAGDAKAAEPWLRSLRALDTPLADTIAPKTYLDAQTATSGPPAGLFNSMRSAFLHGLDDDLLEALPALIAEGPSRDTVSLLHWHGAPCRIPPQATAFPHREPGFSMFVTAIWPDPAQNEANVRWVERVWGVVAPRARGTYVNLIEEEGPQGVRTAYGDNLARLATIKRRYDPDNFFRLNHNVAPAD
jgi:FAD/FMN-containing dehydrogenase